ncbi:hypothetical protein H1R20_g4686, partial [Candolleomyces eurysporus]
MPDVETILNYCVHLDSKPAFKYVYDPPDGTSKSNIEMRPYPAVIHDARGTPLEENACLDENGFKFVHHVASEKTFDDEQRVVNEYYKEIEELVKKTVPGAKRVFIWDHTIRRLEEQPNHMDKGTPRGPAKSVHIDQTYEASVARVRRHLPEEADRLLASRFRIINVWRPIENPVAHHPLGVVNWRSVDPERDFMHTRRFYPTFEGSAFNVRHSDEHEWWYLGSQTPEECTFIKIFDSVDDGGKTARATAHSAFEDKTSPPEAPQRQSIEFELGFINLNVGSEGALPLPVQLACDALSRQAEESPDKWKKVIRGPLTEATRQRIAPLLGANPDELVFVTTTSHSIDMVLSNFEWSSEDTIVYLTTTWKGGRGDVGYIRDKYRVNTSVLEVNFPTTSSAIIESYHAHLRSARSNQFRGRVGQTRQPKLVALIDAICSKPGIKFPWEEMVRICREEGAYSVVDAAHCLGQQVDLNLSKTQPDFWITSCHKWFYVKRGCSLLYVPRRNHHIMKCAFPHNSYPSASTSTLQQRLEGASTRDFTSFLSVNAAFDFRQWLGGERAINSYCHDLALAGGRRMAEIFQTDLMDESGDFTLNMINVRLPLSPSLPETHDIISYVDRKLLVEDKVYGLVFKHNGACQPSLPPSGNKIILYDLPGHAASDVAWSPNTWKVRFVLNLKGLDYRTVWIEYPDIAQLYQQLGIPSRENRDGKPLYGLPVIYDPSTSRYIGDSLIIAQYLEDTYPSTISPPLFPIGSRGLQAMFIDIFIQTISDPLHSITSEFAMRQLPPRSSQYYRSRREARYGCRLEDIAPVGTERRKAVWDGVRAGFKSFHKWSLIASSSQPFITGDKPCFADFVVASYLTWFKRLLGENSPEWQELMEAEDQRWFNLMKAISPWERVDEEGLQLFRSTFKLKA